MTLVALLFAIFAQLGTIWLAISQIGKVGPHRLAWTSLTMALILMLYSRVSGLELAVRPGMYDFPNAAVQALVSLLLFAGMLGLGHLLAELEAKRKHLEAAAATDHLTGLHNRRKLFERAEEEILRSQRSREPLAVMILDLDHFKRVNDRFGHAVGDAMLTAVAIALRDTLRRVDIAGRIGGEEFAVILPNTDANAAAVAAERLRSAIEAARIEPSSLAISTSIGVTTVSAIPCEIEVQEYFRNLLQEADTALYIAKERGRNRVEFWMPEMAIQAS